MVIELGDEPPLRPTWPEGLELRPLDLETESDSLALTLSKPLQRSRNQNLAHFNLRH